MLSNERWLRMEVNGVGVVTSEWLVKKTGWKNVGWLGLKILGIAMLTCFFLLIEIRLFDYGCQIVQLVF